MSAPASHHGLMLSALAYVFDHSDAMALEAMQQFMLLLAMMFIFFYCWFLQECLLDLPARDRRAPPWLVWLFFLPFIGRIIAFLLISFSIPASFRAFFSRQENEPFGDCGRLLGLCGSLCLLASFELMALGVQLYGIALLLVALLLLARYTWLLMRMRREVRRLHRIELARQVAARRASK